MKEEINKKLTITISTYIFFIGGIWLFYILNNILLNQSFVFLGIEPRSFNIQEILSIFFSWIIHADFFHLLNNTVILSQILLFFTLFEKRPTLTISILVFSSGLMTWLLGSPGTVHIGASGLIFAFFGFIFGSVISSRKIKYILFFLLIIIQFGYVIAVGLIPVKGVSFAAHFGGFLSGIFVGYLINKNEKKSLKEQFLEFKQWNIKLIRRLKGGLKKA